MGQRRTTGIRKKTRSRFRATRCYSRASVTISTMVLWCQNKLSFLPDLLIFRTQSLRDHHELEPRPGQDCLAWSEQEGDELPCTWRSNNWRKFWRQPRDLSTREKLFFFFRRAGLAVNALQIRITACLDDKNICCCDRMHTFIQNQERERLENMRYSSIIVCAQGGVK